MTMNAPCYKCEDRSAACHGRCAKYKEWADSRQKDKGDVFDEYKGERRQKIEHRLGRR